MPSANIDKTSSGHLVGPALAHKPLISTVFLLDTPKQFWLFYITSVVLVNTSSLARTTTRWPLTRLAIDECIRRLLLYTNAAIFSPICSLSVEHRGIALITFLSTFSADFIAIRRLKGTIRAEFESRRAYPTIR